MIIKVQGVIYEKVLIQGKANKGYEFRCCICGQFISYKDFDNLAVQIEYTPDTEFTVERYEYTHNYCLFFH